MSSVIRRLLYFQARLKPYQRKLRSLIRHNSVADERNKLGKILGNDRGTPIHRGIDSIDLPRQPRAYLKSRNSIEMLRGSNRVKLRRRPSILHHFNSNPLKGNKLRLFSLDDGMRGAVPWEKLSMRIAIRPTAQQSRSAMEFKNSTARGNTAPG